MDTAGNVVSRCCNPTTILTGLRAVQATLGSRPTQIGHNGPADSAALCGAGDSAPVAAIIFIFDTKKGRSDERCGLKQNPRVAAIRSAIGIVTVRGRA
jgi:hypothetical protein